MKVMCKYCGAIAFTPYRSLCNSSPHKNHEWGPIYEGLEKQGGGGNVDRRRDELLEQQSQEQLRLAAEQNEILAEQAESVIRAANDNARYRQEELGRQQENAELILDRKRSNIIVQIRRGDVEEIKAILRSGELEINDTAFIAAVYLENSNPATEYLKSYVNINLTNKDGMAALHEAAIAGNEYLIDRLIGAGANVDLQIFDGQTPDWRSPNYMFEGQTALILASKAGHTGAVRKLIELHANPNIADSFGYNALIRAAEHAGELIANQLLAAGVDINAQSSVGGRSALIQAAEYGNVDLVRLLVSRGANLELHDSNGLSALSHCAFRLNALMEEAAFATTGEDGNPDPEITKQIIALKETAEYLLESGADPYNAGANSDEEDTYQVTAQSLLAKYIKVTQLSSNKNANKDQRRPSVTLNESSEHTEQDRVEAQEIEPSARQKANKRKAEKLWWQFWK